MIKARKKWLCILVALTFLLGLMPVSPALAAEYFDISGSYNYVEADDNQNLGSVSVVYGDDLSSITGVVYVEVTLPSDTDMDEDDDVSITNGTLLSRTTRKVLVLASTSMSDTTAVTVDFQEVDIDSDFTGNVTAAVKVWNYTGSGIQYETTENVTIAKIESTAVTISAESPKRISVGSDKEGAKITIDEETPGALDADDTISLTIQKSGVSWDSSTLSTSNIVYTGLTISDWEITGEDDQTLNLTVGTESTAVAGSIEITPLFIVEPGTSDGDVNVKVGGDVDEKTVKVAEVGAEAVDVEVDDADKDTVYLGQSATLDDVEVTLDPDTSFDDDDYITITLPEGLEWTDDDPLVDDSANLDPEKRYNDNQSLWLSFSAEEDDDIVLEDFEISADADAAVGDLKITFGGAVSGEYVIGKVKAPVTAEAEKVNIQPLGSNQAAGKIVIKEAADGALKANTNSVLVLELPMGVEWSTAPDVDVTEGDLDLGTVSIDGAELTIDIDGESDVASTIEITKIKYDVDNRAAAGDIKVEIKTQDGTGDEYFDDAEDDAIATVVNAAIVSATKRDSSFVIGSTTYTVNGEEQTMDVAPYIKDGRTFLPVRYAALACGVDEGNIIWDGAKKTVTLIKGDRVVQMTIGSKAMLINGASVTMDVAPEIVAPGRTMLPLRFVGQALGATVNWDEANQTVTMNVL
ncbi:MAG: copper amine oxidase N-terminal domain-containing protein [Bacillota bacterium]